jgi:hypothetical protein
MRHHSILGTVSVLDQGWKAHETDGQHLQSNFTVTFESDDVAHGRTSCICTHGSDEVDLSRHFMVGGYYYFSFRRVKVADEDHWKISRLILDTNWEAGASFGLFDKREGNK